MDLEAPRQGVGGDVTKHSIVLCRSIVIESLYALLGRRKWHDLEVLEKLNILLVQMMRSKMNSNASAKVEWIEHAAFGYFCYTGGLARDRSDGRCLVNNERMISHALT